ncbi:DUF397 domain-containing protein [Amycolatopsis sp. CA-128772]|uniref:DUF397 domain-containing protein n=1 Tax=Amycolatopsis sp. CA-128772 TaxID=2073159 RepID=UPI000CD02A61|nr:DUF397 domain-containing protein [Amycolatopsis sp. CA-128772]
MTTDDEKAAIRDQLDLAGAEWHTYTAPSGATVEVAYVDHADDAGQTTTYTVVRDAADRGNPLVYTAAEWDAFVKGVDAGVFDPPQ